MLLKYIEENFEKDEPFFISDLPCGSKESLRQELKRLTDEGKIERIYNGTYCRAYTTILGTKGKYSFKKLISKKYLVKDGKEIGFVTGLSLANKYGFTTQVPSVMEVTSNEASTKHRKFDLDGKEFIVYSPVVEITEKNISAIRFLDMMLDLDKYCELNSVELNIKLKEFIATTEVDFEEVKKIINLYPDRVYRNIYEGGLMNELV